MELAASRHGLDRRSRLLGILDDRRRRQSVLTDYCLANIDHILAAWWQLGDDLLVKYNHMWVFDKATRKRGPLKFPDWWLKLLVEYNQLAPQPAAKK